MNYYELLGVTFESTENEILKAYRKKALLCHPDKNPDNPKAAELFIEIAEALKILTDPKAREALNKVIKAKEAAKLRTKAYDAKRKKFKEDLENREKAAQEATSNDTLNAERLAAEIKRLRSEGSRLLKEQQLLVEKQLNEDRLKKHAETSPKLKVTWACSNDHQNGGYNERVLKQCFEKYGPVTAIVLSKKNGLAIVEFMHHIHANMALEFEKGLDENPFQCSWLEGENFEKSQKKQVSSLQRMTGTANQSTDNDFESIVLAKMRQAEERKRLAQKIMEEDAASQ
ncbi:dnaJ homolog subfamily C member 17 isoform X2 [Hydra vulgaris]|uniref:DnaJ homolog subfamily C member 17 isoform X2 n=1 Tax=Hydra vulgaris TaxID=6087 RepID=A0ABM4CID4_HYDVU